MTYDIHYDRTETYNRTDVYFQYEVNVTKTNETGNIFTVDTWLKLKYPTGNDWKVKRKEFINSV